MKRYILIVFLACCALSASAREFEKGEKLYFNAKPADATWWKDGTAGHTIKLWGRLVDGSAEYWIEAQWYGSDNCYLEIPDDANATGRSWSKLILYRCAYNNRNDVKNKTGEINIDANYDKNYLQNFYYGTYKEEANWWNLTFSPSGAPTGSKVDGIAKEVMSVCTSSTGDPLSLQPILAGNPLIYDYNHSAAHAWFKWNGSAWVALDGQSTGFYSGSNAWGYEGGTKLKETIGAAGSHTYYFLWAEKPSRRRFLEVAVTKDCSPTCEITDFGVVTSSVNVHDSTYTLDGVVAFGDATGLTLRISVTDAKGLHKVEYVSPTTPFIFSLPGLFANGATGVVAKAEFIETECALESKPYTAPNAIEGIETVNINQSYGVTTTLTPSTSGAGGYKWNDGNTTDHERTLSSYNYDITLMYTYYEYEKAPSVSGDLIRNGDFSEVGFDYGTTNYTLAVTGSNISEYNYWGKDVTTLSDFYDTHKDGGNAISGGMAIVTNTNDFWKRYTKKINPKKSSHFALFDADNSGTKKAWVITTDRSPKLTLAKGTNYMFSFWVANINNYGEMNNAAKLQFAIRYKQGGSWSTEELLGKPIDLNDYQDNIWHQNSYVYTSPVDASDVEIMVRDLNASANPGGNDFALDDIQFQPISVVSQAIKNCERFVVKIFEPATIVEKPIINITETPACGKTDFTMTVDVSYSTLNNKITPITLQLTDDVYGDIFATPITIDPAVNPNSISFTLKSSEYPMLVADAATHTLTAKITRINGKGVDKGGQKSNTYVSPTTPAIHTPVLTEQNKACDKVTYDLQVATEYLAFKGTKLHYEWDDSEWTDAVNPALSYSASWQTATGKLKNLPADGKNHKLRVYSDNALDCDYTFAVVAAPYMPSVTVSAVEIQPYKCDDENYSVKVTIDFTNGQGHDLIIKNWDGTTKTITTEVTDTKKSWTFTYDWDATPTSHEYNVYFDGATTCDHKKSYTSDVQPTLTVTPSTLNKGCDNTTYSLRLDLAYVNQRGDNIIANVDGGTDVVKANAHKSEMTEATDYIQFDNLPADGKTHQYTVRFDNTNDCKFVDIDYTAPYGPKINSATAVVSEYHCGDGNYSVKVEVQFVNGQGHDLIIEDWNGNKQHVTTVAADTKKGYNFSYGWDVTGVHAYKVYFEGAEGCGVNHQPSFTAPTEPKLTDVAYTISPATACNKPTYDMTVTFNYINQDGSLSVDVDGIAPTTITPAVLNSSVQQTATATFEGMPADGGTTHTLNIAFTGGTHGCEAAPVTLTGVPHLPVINSVKQALAPDYACGEDKYHVTLTVNYTNALGKKIVVKEGSTVLKSVTANTGAGTFETSIPLDFDFGTNHTLKVYFENRESCAESLTVTSPAKPKVKATYKTVSMACDKTTYDLEVEIKYTNQNGTLNVNVDGTNADPATVVFIPDSPTEQTLTAVVKNLPADGASTHVLTVAFTGGSHSCAIDPENITAPYGPKISGATAAVLPYACGDDKYKVKVEVNFSNGQGHNLIIEDWKGNKKSITTASTDTKAEQTFSYDWEAPTSHAYKVYFVGAEGCATNHVQPSFTAPAEPKIENVQYNIVPATDCSKTTYDMTVTFKYTNQDGTLSVDVDGTAPTTITPAVFNSSEQQTCTAKFVGLPADGGAAHKLNIAFAGGTHGCAEGPVTLVGVPHLPVINSVKQALTPDYACGEDKYHVTLTVNYTNALGKKIVVKEGSTILKSVTANTGAGTFETSIPLDFDFGTNHTLKVYFENRESCAESLTVTSPAKPKVTATYQVANTACDKTTYDLEVEIKYTNQNGTLNVSVDGTNADPATVVFIPDSPTEQTLTAVVKNLPADGASTHVLAVAFTGGSHSCAIDPVNITAPYGPQISAATATVLPYACGDDKYKVKVEVNFSNGQGHNLIIEDWKGNKKSITTASTDTKAEQTFSYDWEAPTSHAYKVYFVGAEGCNNHKPSFKSPAEPKLKVTPTVINPDCDVTKYTLRLDLTYTNQRGNNILANVDGGADVTKVNAHKSEAAEAEEFILIEGLTADGKVHTFNLRFDGSNDCDTLNGKFTAPYSPQIGTAKAAVQPYTCGDKKYQVKVEVPFANGQGHNLVIEDWKGNKQSIATAAADTEAEYTFEYAWETPATHAYTVYFVGAEGCNNHKPSFKSPAEPKLTVKPTVINPDCDVTTYSLRLDLKYTNQQGNNILANVDGGADVTKANAHKSEAAEAEEFILIEGLTADGKVHTFNLRFDGSNDCDTLNGKFTAPYSPKIGNTTAFVNSYACGDNTYEAIVAVHFENGQGHNLVIEDWNGNKQTIATAVEDTEIVHRFEYAWEAPTTHAYKIYFVGAETCGKYKGGFEVPLWHHIDTVTVESDATVPCNDPTFNANVTIKTPYDITGVDLVLTYDDNGEKTTSAKGTGTSTVVPLVLHTIEGPDQTITVTFLADPACGKTSDAFTPAKRAGCRKDEATICEGDTYPWIDGNTYPLVPFIGTDTFTRGYDSLILTVKALPKITLQAIGLTCEDEVSIALPYSLDKGEPDTWSLTVDGAAQPITAVTATDILIPSLAPGPHRAVVTVGVAGITCETTATVDFTVAVANQVYSKWTDVLFVDNKAGLYTAYQWYADNKLMDGETQQRLYDPKGLSGNNVIYYCELTTTAGKTLYTCPQKFEDAPRSADQNTGENKVQSTMIYDNMGRSISSTPKDGMYIIVEKLENGDVRVRKIAVYE